MSNCLGPDDLCSLSDVSLPDDRRLAMETHLAECADCQSAWRRFCTHQGLTADLRAACRLTDTSENGDDTALMRRAEPQAPAPADHLHAAQHTKEAVLENAGRAMLRG